MNQKNNKFRIILGIILILAIIICSFIVENCNNNKNLLIDADNKSDGEYIIKFLKEKKQNNLDYFVITHGDMDHI